MPVITHTAPTPGDRRPPLPLPVLDQDNNTVTIAVTFKWQRPWALSKCEAGVLVGDLRRLLNEHYQSWEQLAGIESVVSWDDCEEVLLHAYGTPLAFPNTNL